MIEYTFFQNALWASLLTGLLCGFIGTYVVTRRMVFIAGGIAHSSLGGVGICALLGVFPMLGAGVAALATGYGVNSLSHKFHVRQDSAIAMLWALGMSVGVLCSYLSPAFLPDLPNYIFGNILLTTRVDLILLFVVTMGTILYFVLQLPQITAISYDRDFASSSGLPVWRTETILTFLIALSVVAVLKVMGIVLAICMLSIPQMTASLLTHTYQGTCLWSAFFSIISCLSGLAISVIFNVPSGASIVLVSIAVYATAYTIKAIITRFNKRSVGPKQYTTSNRPVQ